MATKNETMKNGQRIMDLRNRIQETLKSSGRFNEVLLTEMALASLAFAVEMAFEAGIDAERIGLIATKMEELRARLRAQVLDAAAQKLADALAKGDEKDADKAADAILQALLGPGWQRETDCDCPGCKARRDGTDPNVEAVSAAAAAGYVAGDKN